MYRSTSVAYQFGWKTRGKSLFHFLNLERSEIFFTMIFRKAVINEKLYFKRPFLYKLFLPLISVTILGIVAHKCHNVERCFFSWGSDTHSICPIPPSLLVIFFFHRNAVREYESHLFCIQIFDCPSCFQLFVLATIHHTWGWKPRTLPGSALLPTSASAISSAASLARVLSFSEVLWKWFESCYVLGRLGDSVG